MKEILSGTLAIDLGNTNTVIAFQDQKDINSVLVKIPNITSSPGVVPTAVWFEEPSKILKIGMSALRMRNSTNSDLFFHSNFKRLIGNSVEKINKKNILNPNECGEKFFQILWANIPHKYEIKRLVLTAPIDTYKGYREWLINLCEEISVDEIAISSTDISSQRLTNHSLYPLYVSMGAVKTSLLISYFCGMFAHKI